MNALTTERITRLVNRRERLTNRRDGRINFPAVDEIDEKLREVPPGERPDVDALLGRKCAAMPKQSGWTKEKMEAVADRFAQIFVEQVEALGGKAEVIDTPRAAAIAEALEREGARLAMRPSTDTAAATEHVAELADEIRENMRDWHQARRL